MTAGVVPVRPSDRDGLARLFSRVEGGFSMDVASEAWRWRMESNPANPGGAMQAWRFELEPGGEVVGYLGSIPVTLQAGSRRLRASWSIDLVAIPEYRSRGVAPFLYRAWLPTVEVAMALGTTPDSLAFLRKSGWRWAGCLPCFRRVLNPGAYLPPRARVLGRLAKPLLAPRPPRRGEAGPLAWGTELDDLWDRACGGMGTAVRRDLPYASWRFRDRPDASYECLSLRVEGRLEGVAFMRERIQNGRRVGILVDLWAAPDALGDLIDHAVAALARRGVDVVHTYATHGILQQALRSARFRSRSTSIQFLFRAADGVEVPSEPSEWWITLGDSDQDRA